MCLGFDIDLPGRAKGTAESIIAWGLQSVKRYEVGHRVVEPAFCCQGHLVAIVTLYATCAEGPDSRLVEVPKKYTCMAEDEVRIEYCVGTVLQRDDQLK